MSGQGRAGLQVAGDRKRGGQGASGAAAGVSAAALFASYHASIRRYILSMVHDPVEADDLTQDVFLQAGDSAGAGSRGDIADQPRLDRVLEQADMSACVRRYLEDLPSGYRQVIFLHDLEELSNPEIARMLGLSLDAVKIRLHRARRKLQDALSRHCDLSLDEQGVLVCEPRAGAPAVS